MNGYEKTRTMIVLTKISYYYYTGTRLNLISKRKKIVALKKCSLPVENDQIVSI